MMVCRSAATFEVKVQGMNDRKQIRVSYLITTRNRAQYLQRTLDNVREFITSEDELIVIDGGSVDETIKVIKTNQDIISSYISENDCGEAHGFNKGLFLTNGQYIKLLTDDDYINPHAIHQCIKIMEEDKSIEILIAAGETYFITKNKKEEPIFRGFTKKETLQDNNFSLAGTKISGQGMLLRKSALFKIGILDVTKKYPDVNYLRRIIQSNCKTTYCNIMMYEHYIQTHSGCINYETDDKWKYELAETFFYLKKWNLLLQMPQKAILEVLRDPPLRLLIELYWKSNWDKICKRLFKTKVY